jgi:hypothetical protein
MVKLGKTEVNREAAKAMGKDAFMKTFKGVITIDLNQAWDIINKGVLMTSTDGNEKPKKYGKKANEVAESPGEEKQG